MIDLEAIRKFTVDQRHQLEQQPGYFSGSGTAPVTPMETALAHIRTLLAEVERLREEASGYVMRVDGDYMFEEVFEIGKMNRRRPVAPPLKEPDAP